jgi:hypothetical protein
MCCSSQNLKMKVKIMKASIDIPVPTTITVVQLKGAAKQADITGVSGLRKAELEDAVMSERGGRKQVYQIREGKWAEQIIAETLEIGVFTLHKPVLAPLPTPTPLVKLNPSGKCVPNKELRKMKQDVDRQNARIERENQLAELPIIKQNNAAMASFKGCVRALKDAVMLRKDEQLALPYDERDKRILVWSECEDKFMLAIRRNPARQLVNS